MFGYMQLHSLSYILITAALRHDVNSMFLVSYASPQKPVLSRALASWVSDILHNPGIHTKIFKTHSLHSASTSNAVSGGLSLTEVAKTAG